MPKNGLVEIEAVAQIGVQTAGSVLDMNKADSQLWTDDRNIIAKMLSNYFVFILQFYQKYFNTHTQTFLP